MADVALFHHVQGLTEGVEALAARLAEAGHTVHTPDLFDGETFDSIEEGVAHVESIGFGEFIDLGAAVAEDLPSGTVYAGISLGVLPAQRLAQTNGGAGGAVLLEACLPVTQFADAWPASVPVQIHGMDGDPFFAGDGDIDAARAIVEELGEPTATLYLYPGERHLFVDSSLPSYEPEAAALVIERMLEFLARIDGTDGADGGDGGGEEAGDGAD